VPDITAYAQGPAIGINFAIQHLQLIASVV